MDIELLISDETESYENEQLFYDCAEAVFKKLEVEFDACEISILLTNDEHIHQLNKEYREKDKPTDVLSFPMSEDPFEEGGMLGDIVISMDTAKEQAQDAGIQLDRELAFLYIHGLLHLMGYDHGEEADVDEEMFLLQEEILGNLVKDYKVP